MTREEAIERIKVRFDKWALDDEDMKAIQTLIPELNESEDERVRKEIIEYFKHYSGGDNVSIKFPKWIAYLENQKELSELGKYIEAERTKPGFMFEGNDSVSWKELPLGVRKHDYPYYFIGDLDCYPFNVEKKKSIIEKLREISTPADEDWFEIEKKWEAEDNEDLRSFISLKFASNAKVIDGKRFAVLTWERFKDVALDLINRGKEKQKEQETEEYSPLCNTIKDKIQEYIANNFITDTVVKTDVNSIVKAMEEGVRLGKQEQKPKFNVGDTIRLKNSYAEYTIESISDGKYYCHGCTIDIDGGNRDYELVLQKPVEWSEEDEEMLCEITRNVNAYDAYTGTIFQQLEHHDKKIKWLNSLGPRHITYELDAPFDYDKDMNPIYPPINHWKPSECQMAMLRAVLNDNDNMASESANMALESLYNDLEKLYENNKI